MLIYIYKILGGLYLIIYQSIVDPVGDRKQTMMNFSPYFLYVLMCFSRGVNVWVEFAETLCSE